MRPLNNWLFRQIAVCLALWLTLPASQIGTAGAQQQGAERGAANAPSHEGPAAEPATRATVAESALPDTPEPVSPQAESQGAQDGTSQSGSTQQEATQPEKAPAKPVGTAAAPYEKTMGIAASRPAGAAIAPAKQRRVRTILISVGVIVAAGVAVGSVAALSHGSASRPK